MVVLVNDRCVQALLWLLTGTMFLCVIVV